VENTSPSFNIK